MISQRKLAFCPPVMLIKKSHLIQVHVRKDLLVLEKTQQSLTYTILYSVLCAICTFICIWYSVRPEALVHHKTRNSLRLHTIARKVQASDIGSITNSFMFIRIMPYVCLSRMHTCANSSISITIPQLQHHAATFPIRCRAVSAHCHADGI